MESHHPKGVPTKNNPDPAPPPCGTACAGVWGGLSDGVSLGLDAGRVKRRHGDRFDASALHVGDQLVGDLSQHILSKPRHAQHVVPRAVHVVSERDKLLGHGRRIKRKHWILTPFYPL